MDKYVERLQRAASDVEAALCFDMKVGGTSLRDLPIKQVIKYCTEETGKLTNEAAKTLNRNVGRKIAVVAYLAYHLEFLGKQKLDFSKMPCGREVASALLPFTRRSSITEDTIVGVDQCAYVIELYERNNCNVKQDLTYRYVRLFTVLASIGMFGHASVIANLMLTQMIVGGTK